MKRVLVIDADDLEQFWLSVAGATLTIGDSPSHADVALRDLHILRIRCEIEVSDDVLVLTAPAVRALGGGPPARRELRAGEAVRMGHANFRLRPAREAGGEEVGAAMDETLPEGADPTPDPARLSAARPSAAPAPARLRKQLLVIDGADHKESFRLPYAGTATIGNSGRHADICLHDFYVSRVHCSVETVDDKVFVTHSEGKNGTLINGQRITQRQEFRLGDVLRVGNSHLRLEAATDDRAAPVAPPSNAPASGQLGTGGSSSTGTFALGGTGSATLGSAERPEGSPRVENPDDRLKSLDGQVIGHFRLGPLVGTGHSGIVHRAQDVKTGQAVALKMLGAEFPASGAELQQLAQALKAATPLQHANLVNLFGAGKSGSRCWIAREYVEGESVDQLVTRLKEEGKLAWPRALRVAVHLANALAFLHEHKAVHGNITPRNILVSSADKGTKLADLMLDKALAGSRLQKSLMEKKLLSELPFMAPEQVEPDAFVDHLADLYALGAVVYFLATGEMPFAGDSPEQVIAKIRETPVARPSRYQRKIPFPFEGVVLKLLAKRQEDRYQTATELLTDLDVLTHDHQIQV
jgi:hypothetical protein